MYLLIPKEQEIAKHQDIHLHSTMYLLIPNAGHPVIAIVSEFTFHYVSINSPYIVMFYPTYIYLHSTMYLLIRLSASISDIIVLDLHSTMYLLILIQTF